GTIGETNAGDVAFRDVAARLLAVAPIFCRHSERSRGIPPKNLTANNTGSLDFARDDRKEAYRREAAAVCSRGGVCGYHICRAISCRRCAHFHRGPCCTAAVERACLVCEILAARFLAK